MNTRFNVVSLFCGCGGSSCGYHMAGGNVLFSVEWDDNAAACYRANFPETHLYHGDIHNLSVEEILSKTNLKVGELDILDGSPPCQGFSTAKGAGRTCFDSRNQLYHEYVRILRGLKPKTFIMENVSGMIKGNMKLIFADILKELKESGYDVKARLMNAKWYGVPQSRERMIFVGVRNDLKIPASHPKPQTTPISVKNALKDCVVEDDPLMHPKRQLFRILWENTPPGDDFSDAYKKIYGKDNMYFSRKN